MTGRELADFRPGLPLHEFVTVFVRSLTRKDDHPNADHVEQMHQSRCFRESQGALGCISCHNPHELPAPEEKVAHYRDRCLNCHADKGWRCAPPARRKVSPEDSCVVCHMPRVVTSDVVHLATTHHGIVRHRESALRPNPPPRNPPPGQPSLVPFHRDLMSDAELRATSRDLGVALRGQGRRYAAEALPLLEKAPRITRTTSLPGNRWALRLWGLGRQGEALGVFESILEQSPTRRIDAGFRCAARRSAETARPRRRPLASLHRRRSLRSDYYADLSEQLVLLEQWPAAIDAANQALRLSPANRTARTALILATFRSGFPQEARAQFDTLLEFDPPDRETLVRWFEGMR